VFNVPRIHELALSLKQLRAILEDDKHGEGKKLVSSGGYNLAFVLVNGQVCFLEITRMFGVWMVKLPSKSSQNTCWKAGVRILYNPQKPGA
jgi:hypothetical protein